MTASKYHNKRTSVDGFSFASQAEAKRYGELKLLQRAGEISGLTLQPRFVCVIGGVKVCTYIADFAYFENNRRVVVDVKGFATPVYKLKKKLVMALNPGLVILDGTENKRGGRPSARELARAA